MNSESFQLHGRVALVTGAGGHLGRAIARSLAAAGAFVLLNGRETSRLEDVLREIQGDRGQGALLAFDVTSSEAIAVSMLEIKEKWGRLDVLVNNAYSGKGGTTATATPEDFAHSYAVSVIAASQLVQASLPLLETAAKKNFGGASIINIASMYGLVSPKFDVYAAPESTNPPFYGAAKAGLIQMTRYMSCELAPRRIRVNALTPGPFPADSVQENNPGFITNLSGLVPLGRMGTPSELGGPVVFLASDAASYITGAVLPVDGGWTAW